MPKVELKTACRSCGGAFEPLFNLGNQQVVNLGDKEPLTVPLVVVECRECGLVQLDRTVDKDYLFRNYYYRSGATKTMREHLKGVVDEVVRRTELKSGDVVLDIGSNDGTLLGFYPDGVFRVGFEPSYEEVLYGTDLFISPKFFALEYTPKQVIGRVKVITALAMFYALDNPNAFLQDIKKELAPDGLLILQVNYLPETLRNNAVGDFVHEHLCYYSLKTLRELFLRNGLAIFDVTFSPINGGSMIAWAEHISESWDDSDIAPTHFFVENESVGKALRAEKQADYLAFYERAMVAAVKVKAFTLDKVVDIIGASTRGATFLQFAGIKGRFCVERDASKVGKTYLGLPIVSEETSNANPPDVKLVGPTWFLDEIKERERSFLDSGGTILVPLPTPRLLTKDGEKAL